MNQTNYYLIAAFAILGATFYALCMDVASSLSDARDQHELNKLRQTRIEAYYHIYTNKQ
jgi:uncharacterized membrane protein